MEKVSGVKKAGQILRLKCPGCGKTNVFYRLKFSKIGGVPRMKTECETCGYRFDKKPGYYLGAMYISYGLAVIEGLLAFLLAQQLLFGLTEFNLALISLAAILLCATWNYRLARVVWMNFFPEVAE